MALCVPFCAAAAPLRVAIFAPADSGAAALLTAEVSQLPGIEVVEPQAPLGMPATLGESTGERLALGRLLAADLLLLVEPKRNAFAWIDARTGEELFRIREDSPGQLARSAVALVEEQRDAAANSTPATSAQQFGISGATLPRFRFFDTSFRCSARELPPLSERFLADQFFPR